MDAAAPAQDIIGTQPEMNRYWSGQRGAAPFRTHIHKDIPATAHRYKSRGNT